MSMRGVALLTTAIMVLAAGAAEAQSTGGKKAFRVKRHFKIERPAQLTRAEALAIYDNIGADMAKGYAASRDRTAMEYRKWRRYNSVPYRSETHGNRYVNNFANAKAKNYGQLKPNQKMPPGAAIAKDSFTVTSGGDVFGGGLFVMEKLAPGRSPATADWRYVMILPDGSFMGDSTGEQAANVAFCHGCHKNVAETDYLFFLPEPYRRRFLKNSKSAD